MWWNGGGRVTRGTFIQKLMDNLKFMKADCQGLSDNRKVIPYVRMRCTLRFLEYESDSRRLHCEIDIFI